MKKIEICEKINELKINVWQIYRRKVKKHFYSDFIERTSFEIV